MKGNDTLVVEVTFLDQRGSSVDNHVVKQIQVPVLKEEKKKYKADRISERLAWIIEKWRMRGMRGRKGKDQRCKFEPNQRRNRVDKWPKLFFSYCFKTIVKVCYAIDIYWFILEGGRSYCNVGFLLVLERFFRIV